MLPTYEHISSIINEGNIFYDRRDVACGQVARKAAEGWLSVCWNKMFARLGAEQYTMTSIGAPSPLDVNCQGIVVSRATSAP